MRSHPSYRPALAALFLAAAHGASLAAQTPVHWSTSSAGTIARGGTLAAHIAVTIDPGWHVYSLTQGPGGPIPARITLASDQPFTLEGAAFGPAPHTQLDPNFKIQVEEYTDSATFTVPIRAAPTAPVGKGSVLVRVRYQACSASLCLPPKTQTVAVPVLVAANGAALRSHGAS